MEVKTQPVTLGHVHLKVRNLDRAVAFYADTLGLIVSEHAGDCYAFLTDGSLHHVIALQNVGDAAPNPPPHSVGLYHTAFAVPDKPAFAERYRILMNAGIEAVAVDHGISWAIYFADPDGNGLEIYVDMRGEPDGQAAWRGISRALSEREITEAGSSNVA